MRPVCLHMMILHYILPCNIINDKLVDLIERTYQREGSIYIAYYDRHAFSPLM